MTKRDRLIGWVAAAAFTAAFLPTGATTAQDDDPPSRRVIAALTYPGMTIGPDDRIALVGALCNLQLAAAVNKAAVAAFILEKKVIKFIGREPGKVIHLPRLEVLNRVHTHFVHEGGDARRPQVAEALKELC